jgi:hypothetical protein
MNIKKCRTTLDDKLERVEEYLSKIDNRVDIGNSPFVDAYIKKFSPKHYIQPFGANKCPEIGRVLKAGYDRLLLNRARVGLSKMEPGFPKWVYTYTLAF